jgi:hypothetical protein
MAIRFEEDDNQILRKERPVVRTTINRVAKTPLLKIKMRGKEWEVEQPEIGSIVTMQDNGYSNAMDRKESFVVSCRTLNKLGVVTSVGISGILEITDTTVTFDSERVAIPLKLYTNQGYARWADCPTHGLYFYRWDRYTETYEGDHNK